MLAIRRGKGRLQSAAAAFHRKTMGLQRLGQQRRGTIFLESQFRVGMDGVANIENEILYRCRILQHALF